MTHDPPRTASSTDTHATFALVLPLGGPVVHSAFEDYDRPLSLLSSAVPPSRSSATQTPSCILPILLSAAPSNPLALSLQRDGEAADSLSNLLLLHHQPYGHLLKPVGLQPKQLNLIAFHRLIGKALKLSTNRQTGFRRSSPVSLWPSRTRRAGMHHGSFIGATRPTCYSNPLSQCAVQRLPFGIQEQGSLRDHRGQD